MVPPIWLDESGTPRPGRRCLRCGREAPVYRFRLEHLGLIGWRLFAPAGYVNWCGHAQEFVVLPEDEGVVPIGARAWRGEVITDVDDQDPSPAARADALVRRLFEMLHECRTLLAMLAERQASQESTSARVERLVYFALLGSLEAGLVRTMKDAMRVLRQASAPLGPMGTEWLQTQEGLLDQSREKDGA